MVNCFRQRAAQPVQVNPLPYSGMICASPMGWEAPPRQPQHLVKVLAGRLLRACEQAAAHRHAGAHAQGLDDVAWAGDAARVLPRPGAAVELLPGTHVSTGVPNGGRSSDRVRFNRRLLPLVGEGVTA